MAIHKHDTNYNDVLKLHDDADLEVYSSPKKGVTPITNVLKKIASKDSFRNLPSNVRNSKETPKQQNLRAGRYYKPVKKIKSTTRVSSLKRQRESINNALSTSSSKNSKRYGSVPKQLADSGSKYYKIYKNPDTNSSYMIKPPHEKLAELNNSFPSIKNTNSANSSGVFSYSLVGGENQVHKSKANILSQNDSYDRRQNYDNRGKL